MGCLFIVLSAYERELPGYLFYDLVELQTSVQKGLKYI